MTRRSARPYKHRGRRTAEHLGDQDGDQPTIGQDGQRDRGADQHLRQDAQAGLEIHALEASEHDRHTITEGADEERHHRQGDGHLDGSWIPEHGGEADQQWTHGDGANEPQHEARPEQRGGPRAVFGDAAHDVVLLPEINQHEARLHKRRREVEHAVVVSTEMPRQHGRDTEGHRRGRDLAGDQG